MRDTAAFIPADGWRAVYAVEDAPDSEDATEQLRAVPLVAFALLMDLDDGEEQLVGMVPDGNVIVPCMSPTFVGYLERDRHLSSMLRNLEEWRTAQAQEAEREALAEEVRGEQMKSASEKPTPTGPVGPN